MSYTSELGSSSSSSILLSKENSAPKLRSLDSIFKLLLMLMAAAKNSLQASL